MIFLVWCAHGYNVESSLDAVSISESFDNVFATCGISPNDVSTSAESDLHMIEKVAKENSKVVAIGEIGLDYYWNKENKDIQKRFFAEQIDIANRCGLPIVIHTRDAAVNTIEMLKENPVQKRGVFHCCPLNQELIKEALKLDFYISFSGNVTFKNAKSADCIKLVPLNRILIETDSPYLSPEPNRGKINTSANVKYVAMKIAEVKGVSVEEIAKITMDNAKSIFEINW